ncbi:helix-turn-helix transcriptional regulator [Methanothermococcus thermolithotrophicus]
MNILTDEEKMIIGLIKEHGDITQKDLVEITGMTKPKISRMVSDLEQRGIIRKVKIGRINKIVISDDFKGDCYGP